jgi:nucleoside-diphosphate-sugar epimerase
VRILITGATGFIGRHLVARLAPEHDVYALVRRAPASPQPTVQYICQDLAQPLDRDQLPQHLDAIIHQATVIDTDSVDVAMPFLVNVVGTWRLLEYAAAVGVQTFVHASTGGVYGCSHQPLRESDPPNPLDLYSLTKAQAELAVQAAAGAFHKVVLRYFFPYGVGTPNPIPSYVRRAVRGEPIEILASGGPWFNPLHITDAVELTVQALALNQSATVNIAGQEATTFARIAEMATRTAGREPILQPIPTEAAIPYYRANLIAATERMNQLFAKPTWVSLQQGVTELATHYMNADGTKPV